MAITTSISQAELARVGATSYEGKTYRISLGYDDGLGLTANTFRVRVEGNTAPSGSGSPRVHEIAFFAPSVFGGVLAFEVRMGLMPETTGLFNLYSASDLLTFDTPPTPAADKSWVFADFDGTGTDWAFIFPGRSVTPVE